LKRRIWKRVCLIAAVVILAFSAIVYQLTFTGDNIYPNTNKRHAMIRLEDVGPGGEYNSLEGLGKLRAVMEYIESKHIPFHVAVIPRRISVGEDGIWEERGIDDPNPDPVVKAFIRLLQEGEQRGGILGMHGYSHQYGDSIKNDDSQNSGTGAEFDVKGAPETKESSYAAERITNSLAAFEKAGLQPAFWESPHYKDTREQEKVFRSYIGILYQPDLFSLRSFKDLNVYDTTNAYGKSSLGSVYVPAPYSYVTDGKSVDRILSKAADDNGLASMYFHPFLEFPYLEKKIGADGKQVEKDGLPVFKYKEDGTQSYLHRLVDGFAKMGYHWMSLYDIVPFTPAHRVTLPLGAEKQRVLTGDVTGQGHADVVVVEKRRVVVIPGNYTLPRNRPQQAAEVWLKETFTHKEQLLLIDWNNDGKQDLMAYNEQTGMLRVGLTGEKHFQAPVLLGKLPSGLQSLKVFSTEKGSGLIAKEKGQILLIHNDNNKVVTSTVKTPLLDDKDLYIGKFQETSQDDILTVSHKDYHMSILHYLGNDQFTKPIPIKGINLNPASQLLVGDSNGDGKSDLIVYSPAKGIWQEYENRGNHHFLPLDNAFGPWADGKGRRGLAADFDGNGKTDIGSYDETEHILDIALSFRSMTP
jgi:hypothetical protein